ncbi:Nipped-B-like protein B [Durusdinium trenchii]|uniref:Nipped-B-like protein B n=1 Tax=Durusdinium trenchii TaxID=1381693 RepID=A0ABP0KBP3_9DINO
MSYTSLAELLAAKAEPFLATGSEAVAELLEAMVNGSIQLDTIPGRLLKVFRKAPFATAAAIIAGLGEKGLEGEEMQACAKSLVASREALEALQPEQLLRLTVAATKSEPVAKEALDAVASAAALVLNAFSLEDASKLLLAVAKAKAGAGSGVQELYERAAEVIPPKLSELSSGQLIKVVLAVTKVEACRPLLETAAQAAVARVGDVQPSQMMLLMQGLLPLGGEHPALNKIADNWAASFYEATRLEGLLGPDQIETRRKELESKGQLSADQVSKLALMVAPVMPKHQSFWNAFGKRLREMPEDLSDVGIANLKLAFPEGAGPDFEKKEKILKKAYKEGGGAAKDRKKEKEKDRDRDRSRERDRDKSRERDREKSKSRPERDRDRLKDRDRDRDRGRDREKERERERDRDFNGDRARVRTEEEIERQKRQKEEMRRADRERVLEMEHEREKEREKELERRREAKKQMEREKEERKKEKKAKKKEKKNRKEGVQLSSSSSDGGVQLTGLVGAKPAAPEAAEKAVSLDLDVDVPKTVDLDIDGAIELDAEPKPKPKPVRSNSVAEVQVSMPVEAPKPAEDGAIELDAEPKPKPKPVRSDSVAEVQVSMPVEAPKPAEDGAIELDAEPKPKPKPVRSDSVAEVQVSTKAAEAAKPPRENGHAEDIDMEVDLSCQVEDVAKPAEKRKANESIVDLDQETTAKERRDARKRRAKAAVAAVAPAPAAVVTCDLDLDDAAASINID